MFPAAWAILYWSAKVRAIMTGALAQGWKKPALHRGAITPRAMMTLSLTSDHRVIDGAPAAAFLRTVVELFNGGGR